MSGLDAFIDLINAQLVDLQMLAKPGQQRKVHEKQVENNAGGSVFQISDEVRIRRFLILGTCGGTYYVKEKELTFENVSDMVNIIQKGKGSDLLREVIEISLGGRAPKQDSTLMCLALCAKCNMLSIPKEIEENATKKKLYLEYIQQLQHSTLEILPKICRIPTHLFDFVKYCEIISKANKNSSGWGRSMRNAIGKWYVEKEPEKLVMHVTKYQQRNGWSNRDLLRLSHVKPDTKNSLLTDHIFHYIINGKLENDKNNEDYEPKTKKKRRYEFDSETAKKINEEKSICFLQGFSEIKQLKNEENIPKAIELIQKYGFVREHLAPEMLNFAPIWKQLLKEMPMTALLKNLSKLSALDIITGKNSENDEYIDIIVKKFNDEDQIKKSRLHPLTILCGLSTYSTGRGLKGKLEWSVNDKIKEALNAAFYKSFKNVEPTNKKFCLAFDVSSSMSSQISGTAISCRTASAALGLITLKTEPIVETMAFQSEFVPLEINKEMTLEQIEKLTNELPFDSTDCSQPMLWALKNKKEFDVFIVYTDSETYFGEIHPFQALKNYRKEMNLPSAKLIVMGMVANNFTIADPEDRNMLDIVGFDTAVPELIRSFVLNEI